MPMKVRVRKHKVNGEPLQVINPKTGRTYPNSKDINLSDEDLRNPKIVRLLPKSHGGCFGDLVPVKQTSSTSKT